MRIVSWNVNGLRACHQKGFCTWLGSAGADVVAVQRLGYSGVGLFSRRPFDELLTSLDEPELDVEGRLQMARLGRLWIVNGYFPQGNGKNRDLSRIPYKLRFYDRLFKRLEP